VFARSGSYLLLFGIGTGAVLVALAVDLLQRNGAPAST